MAEGFEPFNQFPCGSNGIEVVEVVVSQVPVGCIGPQHLKTDDQNLVTRRTAVAQPRLALTLWKKPLK